MDYNFIYGVQTLAMYGLKNAVKMSKDNEVWRGIAKELNVSLESAPYALVGMDPSTEDMIWNAKDTITAITIIKYTVAICDLLIYALSDSSDKYEKLKMLKAKYFGNIEAIKDGMSFKKDLKDNSVMKYYTKDGADVFLSENGTFYVPVNLTGQVLEYILKFMKIVFLGDDYKPLLLKVFLNFSHVPEFQESEWYENAELRMNLLTCASLIGTDLQTVMPIEINPEKLIKFSCVSVYVDATHRILICKDTETGKYIQELYDTDVLKTLLEND